MLPNIDKCRCVWLGSKKHPEEKLCPETPLIWSDAPFTYLGIGFSVELNEMLELNYSQKILDIKK